MLLTHLTAVGPNVPTASIEFGSGLTVVYGASDTGKSYIAQAIDYVMGASQLKQIPEATGYTHLLLGVSFPDAHSVTLARSMAGGTAEDRKIALYRGDYHILPAAPADFLLAPKHNPRSTHNVSRYLLSQIELDGKLVRRNSQNDCRTLSFRDLARLCIIDETDMQSPVSPVLSGQHVNATVEKSVFKLLVDGRDDADIAGPTQSLEQRRMSRGKTELLDQLIGELREDASSSADLAELQRQHDRVVSSVEELANSVATVIEERDRLLATRDAALLNLSADRMRLGEISDLLGRFTLLREQYDTDLARLDMVHEVGDLLGYFDRGVCVFCGAAVEHQHPPSGHVISEMTELAEVVDAERAKTLGLREDLNATLADVADQRLLMQRSLHHWRQANDEADTALAAVEADLAPRDQALSELLSTRSGLERQINALEQIGRLEFLRGGLAVDEVVEAHGRSVSTSQLAALGALIADLLTRWGVPDSTTVDFDQTSYDLIVAGQPRSSRGKGIRALFHAAYTLGLALHCAAIRQAHPGFVVLDSPLITYRGPETAEMAGADEEFVSQTVADAFFRYLASHSVGQVIVLENTDPPADLSELPITYFTKSREVGRYGYFPPVANTGELW